MWSIHRAAFITWCGWKPMPLIPKGWLHQVHEENHVELAKSGSSFKWTFDDSSLELRKDTFSLHIWTWQTQTDLLKNTSQYETNKHLTQTISKVRPSHVSVSWWVSWWFSPNCQCLRVTVCWVTEKASSLEKLKKYPTHFVSEQMEEDLHSRNWLTQVLVENLHQKCTFAFRKLYIVCIHDITTNITFNFIISWGLIDWLSSFLTAHQHIIGYSVPWSCCSHKIMK